MNIFEEFYERSHDSKFVSRALADYLICEIYSPAVIRQAKARWADIPFYAQEGIHPEIRMLIEMSPGLTNAEIQYKIQAHTIARSAKILLAYSNCRTPLTQDPHVQTFRQNFLSERGKWALAQLLHATTKQPTYEMYNLAIRTGHKFLMDMSYYISWDSSLANGGADLWIEKFQNEDKTETRYLFPTLQLTKGCLNNCSHCEICAKPQLSHMPYPMWRSLYQSLYKRYSLYELAQDEHPEKQILDRYFDRFYADSDPASYYDPIMRVDSGDVALFVREQGGRFLYQTRGVTVHVSRRAIAKAVQCVDYFGISFVDTPLENKKKSFRQLKKTIRIIEKIPNRVPVEISHLYLKGHTTVPQSVFFGFPTRKIQICDWGRARLNFKPTELVHQPSVWSLIIEPNGDIVSYDSHKNEYQYLNSFLKNKSQPAQVVRKSKFQDSYPYLFEHKNRQR